MTRLEIIESLTRQGWEFDAALAAAELVKTAQPIPQLLDAVSDLLLDEGVI